MINRKLKAHVIELRGKVCYYCGKDKLYKDLCTIDHLIPSCMGGKDTIENLVVACKVCNRRKNRKSVQDYIEYRLNQIELEMMALNKLKNKLE
jgi:5-methylcytosine-specific restriction endonuclease McrA